MARFKNAVFTNLVAAVALFFGLTLCSAIAEETKPNEVEFLDDTMVVASLTGQDGDPATGREVFANRKQGNCLACHVNSDMQELSFHGEVGLPLDGVADRYDEAELRAIVVNSKRSLHDETIMPGFYSLELGVRVAEKFEGKTILTAQQVEDVVAYLGTLKE